MKYPRILIALFLCLCGTSYSQLPLPAKQASVDVSNFGFIAPLTDDVQAVLDFLDDHWSDLNTNQTSSLTVTNLTAGTLTGGTGVFYRIEATEGDIDTLTAADVTINSVDMTPVGTADILFTNGTTSGEMQNTINAIGTFMTPNTAVRLRWADGTYTMTNTLIIGNGWWPTMGYLALQGRTNAAGIASFSHARTNQSVFLDWSGTAGLDGILLKNPRAPVYVNDLHLKVGTAAPTVHPAALGNSGAYNSLVRVGGCYLECTSTNAGGGMGWSSGPCTIITTSNMFGGGQAAIWSYQGAVINQYADEIAPALAPAYAYKLAGGTVWTNYTTTAFTGNVGQVWTYQGGAWVQ